MNNCTICIINPYKFAYSETFIKAHIDYLPANIKFLYGNFFPIYMENDKPLVPPGLFHKLKRGALRKIFSLPPQYFGHAALKQFLKINQVDVVLAEYGPTGSAIMDVCKEVNIPFIVHFHGSDAYFKETIDQYGTIYKRMFAEAGAIIAVSHDMEQQLLKLGSPRSKLYYNPYGVDTALFSQANPAIAPPIFLAVGRFVDKKAPQLTILAFKKLLEECQEAKLVMIGDGALLEVCKQIVKALQISNSVEFLGARSHQEVADKMRNVRTFVQHSICTTDGHSEGTPVAILEASATGLPVISTRHGGIVDIISHGETGFLVNEGDINAMTSFMVMLAKDSTLAWKVGQAARQKVIADFSLEKSINNLFLIIEKVINH